MNQNNKETLEALMSYLCSIGPVEEVVFDDAVKFIESIPEDVPLPELCLTEDHDVMFEWSKNVWKIVTAIVDGSGSVNYSARFCAENTSGFYCLNQPFSPLLRDLIEEVSLEEETE
jgi:hypothetical protein